MGELFQTVLTMSLQGLAAAGAVALLHLFLRRTRCAKTPLLLLWVVVAFRLVCPWSPPSSLSLFNYARPVEEITAAVTEPAPETEADPPVRSDETPVASASGGTEISPPAAGSQPLPVPSTAPETAAIVWLVGLTGLFLYTALTYLLLLRRLRFAVKDNTLPDIRYSDRIDSPCVVGFFRPRIILTFGMTPSETAYVLAHERQHIRTGDHIWKTAGWLILCLHWFNPFLWLIYRFFLSTVEDACDQRVLRQLGEAHRVDYGQALLSLSTRRLSPGPSPIAFDEGNTKKRVKTILKYKKPILWVTVIALTVAAVLGACLITGPENQPEEDTPSESISVDAPTATPDKNESPDRENETSANNWEDLILTWYIPRESRDPHDGFPLTFSFQKDFFNASCAGGTPYAYSSGSLLSGHPIEYANGSTLYWWPYEEGSAQPAEHGNITAAVYLDGKEQLACSYLIDLIGTTANELIYSVRLTLHGYTGYIYMENPSSFGGQIRSDDPENALTAPLATFYADLTHDGVEETILIHGDYPSGGTACQGYDVLVRDKAGRGLWSGGMGISHAGQNGIYLLEEDGKTYLMEWLNYSQSGSSSVCYTVFSLTETGEQNVRYQSSCTVELDDFMAADLSSMRAANEISRRLLSSSIVLVSSNGDTPDWEYFSTPEKVLTPILQDNYFAWPLEDIEALQGKCQGSYTFSGPVAAVFEEKSAIMVEDQTLWADTGYPFYFLVPVNDPLQYPCDTLVRVTADGALYRRDLPDEGTTVTVTPIDSLP